VYRERVIACSFMRNIRLHISEPMQGIRIYLTGLAFERLILSNLVSSVVHNRTKVSKMLTLALGNVHF
jgi:hypothetical protein